MPKERQTCTECSMRRQKCDRNLPCSRCVKRGEPEKCTREWPKDGYDPKRHRIYPRPEHPTDGSNQAGSVASEGSPLSELSLHPSLRTPGSAVQIHRGSQDNGFQNSLSVQAPTSDADKEASVLEFLTWGRQNLCDYQVKTFDLLRQPFNNNGKDPATDWDYSNGFGTSNTTQISFLQLLLPTRRRIYQLFDYHVQYVLWYHSCLHAPTFASELDEVFRGPGGLQLRDVDLRWAALLFSIMAGSLTCASDQQAASWGFQKGEKTKLTRQWYKATLSCLNLSDYMWRHHIHSLQAIAVLTMSAHVLGFSNTQSTLLGCALKIAQGLGLQRLAQEDAELNVEGPLSAVQYEKAIRREVGRRLWTQLCNQDWFSIPFSEMYAIQKHHYSTLPPQNVDEDTMLPVATHIPTASSYSIYIHELAAILPQMHDAVTTSTTLFTKYEQVLQYDAKMRLLATDTIPAFMKQGEPLDPSWPHYLPWARRSFAICVAHKIIMIHRNFLGRSFSDPAFEYTRRSSVASSKFILKEARQALDEDGPLLWIDQAFMVASGITLSLDIFHRKVTDPEFEEHRKLVEGTISILGKYESSVIAMRGIRLLSSLLAEQARVAASQSLEKYRKRTRSNEENNTGGMTTTASGDDPTGTKRQRQKFDVPRFVESFVGQDDSFTQSLGTAFRGRETPSTNATEAFKIPQVPLSTTAPSNIDNRLDLPPAISSDPQPYMGYPPSSNLDQQEPRQQPPVVTQQRDKESTAEPTSFPFVDLGYETFEQLFPPQAGISNSFLFEDLLNFDL